LVATYLFQANQPQLQKDLTAQLLKTSELDKKKIENYVYLKITKVHGQEIWWLREPFLASKMRKNCLHASAISKIFPGVKPPDPRSMWKRDGAGVSCVPNDFSFRCAAPDHARNMMQNKTDEFTAF
jgi:hypothetical protein